jgi:hypothetical protein
VGGDKKKYPVPISEKTGRVTQYASLTPREPSWLFEKARLYHCKAGDFSLQEAQPVMPIDIHPQHPQAHKRRPSPSLPGKQIPLPPHPHSSTMSPYRPTLIVSRPVWFFPLFRESRHGRLVFQGCHGILLVIVYNVFEFSIHVIPRTQPNHKQSSLGLRLLGSVLRSRRDSVRHTTLRTTGTISIAQPSGARHNLPSP